jgi:hypothetical protein
LDPEGFVVQATPEEARVFREDQQKRAEEGMESLFPQALDSVFGERAEAWADNPNETAHKMWLEERSGIPKELMGDSETLRTAEARAQMRLTLASLKDAPQNVIDWFKFPYSLDLARDDAEAFKTIGKALGDLARQRVTVREGGYLLDPLRKGLADQLFGGWADVDELEVYSTQKASYTGQIGPRHEGLETYFSSDPQRAKAQRTQNLRDAASFWRGLADKVRPLDYLQGSGVKGWWQDTMSSVPFTAYNGARTAALVLAGGALGGPSGALAGNALASTLAAHGESKMEQAEAWKTLVAQGMDPYEAYKKSYNEVYVPNMALLSATDFIENQLTFGAGGALLKGGRALLRGAAEIGVSGLIEGAQEGAQKLISNRATGQANDWNEIAYESSIGLGMGLLFGGAGKAVKAAGARISQTLQERNQAGKAENSGRLLDEAAKASAASNTLTRSPETFDDFVSYTAKGGQEKVTVSAETFMQAVGPDARAAAEKLGVSGQLDEARATGGDLEIKTGKVLANPELYGKLKDDLRYDEDGMSRNEAREYQRKRGSDWVDTLRQASEAVGKGAAEGREIQEIRDRWRAELEAIAHPALKRNEVEANLDILTAQLAVNARELGKSFKDYVTPLNLRFVYDKSGGLNVATGGAAATTEARTAAQGQTYRQLNPDVNLDARVKSVKLTPTLPKVPFWRLKEAFTPTVKGTILNSFKDGVVNGHTGLTLTLSSQGLDHMIDTARTWLGNSKTEAEGQVLTQAIPQISDLAREAYRVETHGDRKSSATKIEGQEGNLKNVHRFLVPVEMDGGSHVLMLTAKEYETGKAEVEDVSLYDMKHVKKMPGRPSQNRPDLTGRATGTIGTIVKLGEPDDYSVRDLVQDVKGADGKLYYPREETYHQFAGQRAQTAESSKLEQAQELEREGLTNEQIRKKTGWFKSDDGMWRFEIPDDPKKVTSPQELGTYRLGDLYDNGDLYEAYPYLRDMPVIVTDDVGRDAAGVYHPISETISIKRTRDSAQFARTLAHEIQHALQHYEGFANGEDPLNFTDKEPSPERVQAAYDALADFAQKHKGFQKLYDVVLQRREGGNSPALTEAQGQERSKVREKYPKLASEWDKLYQELRETFTENTAYGQYWRTAGEREARDAAARAGLSARELRSKAPDIGHKNAIFIVTPYKNEFGPYQKQAKQILDSLSRVDEFRKGKDVYGLVREISSQLYDIANMDRTSEALRAKAEELQMRFDSYGSRAKNAEAEFEDVEASTRQFLDMLRGGPSEANLPAAFSQAESAARSEAFQKWFGDSKVVDENGAPLVLYHAGTFNGHNDIPREGMHFGTEAASAERAEDMRISQRDAIRSRGMNETPAEIATTPVYLNIKNPKRVSDQENAAGWAREIERAKAEGYDGLVYKNEVEDAGSDSYVAFRPEQIKAVDNSGEWSSENPNIYHQGGEPSPRGLSAAGENLARDEAEWGTAVDRTLADGSEVKNDENLKVMTTPLALKLAGAEVRPVYMSAGKMRLVNQDSQAVRGGHNITPDILKQLPRALADPVMIFESATHPNDSLVVMTELTDINGSTVVVPFHLEKTYEKVDGTFNWLASIYGKDNNGKGTPNNEWFIKQIDEGRLKYIDTEKSSRWLSVAGLQLPNGTTIENLAKSVPNEANLVKEREAHPGFYQGENGRRPATPEENLQRGREAMERVISEHTAVENAMYRDDVGDISILWGKAGRGERDKGGWGVAHIIKRHGEATARQIVDVIANGEIADSYEFHGAQRINIDHNGFTAVLSQVVGNNRRTWLLTGFSRTGQNGESVATGEGYGSTSSGATLSESTPRDVREGADSAIDETLPPAQDVFNQLDAGKRTAEGRGAGNFRPGGGPRGAMTLTETEAVIRLFKDADRSTFAHESAHLFLELRRRMSLEEGLSEQVREDWAATLKWLGVEDMDLSELPTGADAARWREAQEKWAAGFEKYLMEGRAPSSALARAFRSFKRWLTGIYRAVKNIAYVGADGTSRGFEINDEVRAVMDRMLASEDEIEEGQALRDAGGLAAKLRERGVPDGVLQKYQDLVETGADKAKAKLFRKLASELGEEKRAEAAAWKKAIRKRVAGEVWQRPEYKALKLFLLNREKGGLRLSMPDLVERYGDAGAKALLKELPVGVAANDGMSLDEAASLAGYDGAEELLDDLKKAKTTPPQNLIRDRTDQEAAPFESAANDPEALRREAEAAMHSPDRLAWLAMEERLLREQARRTGEEIGKRERGEAREGARRRKAQENEQARQNAQKSARAWAEEMAAKAKSYEEVAKKVLSGKNLTDATAAKRYLAVERRAADRSYRAAVAGDFAEAARMKEREMLNHALAAESMAIQERVEKGRRYLGKFWANRARLRPAVEMGHFAQIMGILERTGFQKEDPRSQDRPRLADWVKGESAKLGSEVEIAPWIQDLDVRNARLALSKLTLSQFEDVERAVRTIETLGRNETRLLADERLKDFQAAVAKVVGAIQSHYGPLKAPSMSPEGAKRSVLAPYFGSLDRIETLTRLLDDLKEQGPVWEALYKPAQDASNKELVMGEAAKKKLDALLGGLAEKKGGQRALQKFLSQRLDTGILDVGTGKKLYWTGENLIAAMLNWGNETNRERLVMGWGLHGLGMEAQFADMAQYDDALAAGKGVAEGIFTHLADADLWDFAQSVWDMVGEYWPQIEELEKTMTGTAPERVEPAPVRTAEGKVLRGGYYPIAFDTSRKWAAALHEEMDLMNNEIRAQGVRAQTRHGHTKQRVQMLVGYPIRLDLGVLQQHLSNVIHDLSYRAAVRDLNKLTKDDAVRENIANALGETAYRQFDGWIKDMAARPAPSGSTARMLTNLIGRAAAVQLGLKLTTALGNFSSLTVAAWRLGPVDAVRGLLGFYAQPWKWSEGFRFALSSSPELRDRVNGADAAIREAFEGARSDLRGGLRRGLNRAAYLALGMSERMISVPIWNAAYDQGLRLFGGDGERAANHADWVIRSTQNTSLVKDKAAIQREGALGALVTLYYSQMGSKYNLFREEMRRMKRSGAPGVARMAAFTLAVFVAEHALNALLKGKPPEDKDQAGLWLLEGGLSDFASAFPVFGPAVNAGLAWGGRNYRFSPALGAFESLAKAVGQAKKEAGRAWEGEALDWEKDAETLGTAAGYALEFPTQQLFEWYRAFSRWMDGQPEFSLSELIWPAGK